MSSKLSKRDILLLSHLRKNARETLTNVSRSTKMPISTIFDKVKKFEQGLVRKHTALLDFEALGYRTRVNVMVAVEKETRERVAEFLQNHKAVNSAYRVNNGFDFIFEVITRDMKELQQFIDLFEEKFKTRKREVFYIVDEISREAFLSNPGALKWEVGL